MNSTFIVFDDGPDNKVTVIDQQDHIRLVGKDDRVYYFVLADRSKPTEVLDPSFASFIISNMKESWIRINNPVLIVDLSLYPRVSAFVNPGYKYTRRTHKHLYEIINRGCDDPNIKGKHILTMYQNKKLGTCQILWVGMDCAD